jgi:hypothetical protein
MHEDDVVEAPLPRKLAQPRDPLVAEALGRRRGVLLEEHAQHRPQLRRPGLLFGLQLGPPQHLVRVAHDPRPTELADPVDDLGGLGAREGQVAGVHDPIDAAAAQVLDHRFQRSQVAVDVGDDGEPGHRRSYP